MSDEKRAATIDRLFVDDEGDLWLYDPESGSKWLWLRSENWGAGWGFDPGYDEPLRPVQPLGHPVRLLGKDMLRDLIWDAFKDSAVLDEDLAAAVNKIGVFSFVRVVDRIAASVMATLPVNTPAPVGGLGL